MAGKGLLFDPFWLAEYLKLRVTARDDVLDARVVADWQKSSASSIIQPSRASRTRFSIAHEIAHTLFPDCAEMARNRDRLSHIVDETNGNWNFFATFQPLRF